MGGVFVFRAALQRKLQQFNIQDTLCPADTERLAPFSVCVCAPVATPLDMSTLKCQSCADENQPGVFKLVR